MAEIFEIEMKTTGEATPQIAIGIAGVIRVHVEPAIRRIPVRVRDPGARAPPPGTSFLFNFKRKIFTKFIRTTKFVRKKDCSFSLRIFFPHSQNQTSRDSGEMKICFGKPLLKIFIPADFTSRKKIHPVK
jgi:hypothetical protein